jgi:hypothetical protein
VPELSNLQSEDEALTGITFVIRSRRMDSESFDWKPNHMIFCSIWK